jgi:hypothetical protein
MPGVLCTSGILFIAHFEAIEIGKKMNYQDAVTALRQRVPEIEEYYVEELRKWRELELPAHIVYVDLLFKVIDSKISSLETTKKDDSLEVLKRIFLLFEELANSSDPEARYLIETGVIEHAIGDPGGWEKYSKFFLPRTTQLAFVVQARFNNDVN